MKKPLLPAILLLMLGVGAVWAVLFYRENLRGFAPAVFQASSDAAALVSAKTIHHYHIRQNLN